MGGAGGQAGAREPAPARRVTLRFSGAGWSVEGVRATPPTIVPASEPVTDDWTQGRRAGWYEAVDAGGRTVYRHALEDPHSERFDEIRGDRIRGTRLARDEGVVSLLVPDAGEGGRVDVYAPSEPGARRIARVASASLAAEEER